MSPTLLIIIAGMAVVTYVPRLLPLLFLRTEHIPRRLQAVLRNVPYAALGALILPGVLTFGDDPWFGIVGGGAAVLTAWLGGNLIVVVVCAITALSVYSALF